MFFKKRFDSYKNKIAPRKILRAIIRGSERITTMKTNKIIKTFKYPINRGFIVFHCGMILQ